MVLETRRLILRPWEESDAEELYRYAKDPAVGPAAGWMPHNNVENSRAIIRDVLSGPEIYAVVLKETGLPVGSVGIMFDKNSNTQMKENEAEIGYWIGVPYWGQGMIPEAVRELQRRCFEDLGCTAVWCGYYDGNARSERVQEKCGFRYHHTETDVPCAIEGVLHTEHFTFISIADWEKSLVTEVPKEKLPEIAPLFDGWEDTIIYSCLQNVMGTVYTVGDSESSAAAVLGAFCFLAGTPDKYLAGHDYGSDFLIMTPQNEEWASMIEDTNPGKVKRRIRYAIKKEPCCFDMQKLENFASGLAQGFTLRQIDEELYHKCLENGWSRDLVSNFPVYEDFSRLGLGFVILHKDEIVSGASSYTRYREGIEIEVDTREDYRRKGLATVCGAALILSCLEKGLYPSWDAQNIHSVALAEKLGYHFDHEYPVYEMEKTEKVF